MSRQREVPDRGRPARTMPPSRQHRSRVAAMIALLGLLAALSGFVASSAADEVTSGAEVSIPDAPERATSAAGQLTLRNAGSETVRIEVRLSSAETCEAAPEGPTHVVPPGRTWLIRSNHAVCWRRAADLTLPVQQWLGWQRRVLSEGETTEVEL